MVDPTTAKNETPNTSADAVSHAVECPTCRGLFLGFVDSFVETGEAPETLGRILPWPVRGAREHDYTEAIDCVLARTPGRFASIRREQAEAPARVAELLRHPPRRRGVLVENSERFWSLAIVDQLLRASREEAYRLVQRNAMPVWRGEGDFQTLLKNDADVKKYLSDADIAEKFDLGYHLKHVDTIFRRVFGEA